jgi:hypothetical protein
MIWQNNVKKIVMLTNLEESGKVINLYFLVKFSIFSLQFYLPLPLSTILQQYCGGQRLLSDGNQRTW